MTVEVLRPTRHVGVAAAQPAQPIQEVPTPLGARGDAGMVSNVHVQPAPRGMTMPTQTMGAQARAS
eukprot:10384667-Alexandrium_andersonii.AAC.1